MGDTNLRVTLHSLLIFEDSERSRDAGINQGNAEENTEQTFVGRGSQSWIPDDERTKCKGCALSFTKLIRRRHHCRKCGEIFCDTCSSSRIVIIESCSDEAHRACAPCYELLVRLNVRKEPAKCPAGVADYFARNSAKLGDVRPLTCVVTQLPQNKRYTLQVREDLLEWTIERSLAQFSELREQLECHAPELPLVRTGRMKGSQKKLESIQYFMAAAIVLCLHQQPGSRFVEPGSALVARFLSAGGGNQWQIDDALTWRTNHANAGALEDAKAS
eukprot:SAG11_NODE_6387_length_1323_cov_1.758987_1_plen_273_part_10